MNRHVGALRWVIRKLFRDSVISVRGETDAALWLRPAEYPILLLGPRRVEADIAREWSALLRPDEVIYDVGANIGFTVQRFHAILRGRCRVWAFEPLERNLELLERNVGGFDNVTVVRCALGDHQGTVSLSDNRRHGGLSRLQALDGSHPEDAAFWSDVTHVDVPMRTVDSFAASAATPTFIKLDVEGAGHWVLSGAEEVLARHRPTISASLHSDDERRGMIEVLARHGYRGVRVDSNGACRWCTLQESTGNYAHSDDSRTAAFAA